MSNVVRRKPSNTYSGNQNGLDPRFAIPLGARERVLVVGGIFEQRFVVRRLDDKAEELLRLGPRSHIIGIKVR